MPVSGLGAQKTFRVTAKILDLGPTILHAVRNVQTGISFEK